MNRVLVSLLFVFMTLTSFNVYGAPLSGKETVLNVETAYNRGDYTRFLRDLDREYKRAGKAGALRGVFEVARTVSHEKPTQKLAADVMEQLRNVEQKRNRRLLQVIEHSSPTKMAQIIDEVVFNAPSKEEITLLQQFSAFKEELHENHEQLFLDQVSTLEMEYVIKAHLLNIGHIRSGSSAEELAKKKMALHFEKFARMQQIARKKGEKTWVEKIEQARVADKRQTALNWNLYLLQEASIDSQLAEKNVEEKVKQIMMEYQHEVQTYTAT